MTNFERWQTYTKNFTSPQSYIDLGYYWMINAALQRRVWYYDGDMALFPNLYLVFVGPPGVGKGLVTKPVNNFLQYHKYEKAGKIVRSNVGQEFPPLFPYGADSITFEELMSSIAESIRRIPNADGKIYSHTSYLFVLEELASLFKHKTSDVVKFLLNAYDCDGYEYKTKHQGKDLIRKMCLSFFAGTQHDFLKEAIKHGIFGDGFSSRTIFCFENRPRFYAFHIAEFTEEQRQAKEEIIAWLKRLAGVFGPLTYNQEVREWLEDWYLKEHVKKLQNAHARMLPYLERMKVHLLKVAAAIHFSESLTYEVPLECFQKALALLNSIEAPMTAGLTMTGRNELHTIQRRVLNFIEGHQIVTLKEVILQFGADLELDEIYSTLDLLKVAHGVTETKHKNQKAYKV